MPSIRGLSSSTSGSLRRLASVSRGTIHQDTASAAAVSDTARPRLMTAVNNMVPEPAHGPGTARNLGGGSKKESREHSGSSQYQRYFDRRTSRAPATGIPRIRWTRAFLRPPRHDTAVGAQRRLIGCDKDLARPSARTVTEMKR